MGFYFLHMALLNDHFHCYKRDTLMGRQKTIIIIIASHLSQIPA